MRCCSLPLCHGIPCIDSVASSVCRTHVLLGISRNHTGRISLSRCATQNLPEVLARARASGRPRHTRWGVSRVAIQRLRNTQLISKQAPCLGHGDIARSMCLRRHWQLPRNARCRQIHHQLLPNESATDVPSTTHPFGQLSRHGCT
jgi:hypothetical protein